jgi:peptide deformylase
MTARTIDLLEYPHLMCEYLTNIYSIRLHPNPVLTEISEPTAEDEFGADLLKVGGEMVELMTRSGGYGLSGPQIGLLKRIFVMRYEGNAPMIVCNLVLELSVKTDCQYEGCLSMPGMQVQVLRSTEIRMEFRTPLGSNVAIRLLGVAARTAHSTKSITSME